MHLILGLSQHAQVSQLSELDLWPHHVISLTVHFVMRYTVHRFVDYKLHVRPLCAKNVKRKYSGSFNSNIPCTEKVNITILVL